MQQRRSYGPEEGGQQVRLRTVPVSKMSFAPPCRRVWTNYAVDDDALFAACGLASSGTAPECEIVRIDKSESRIVARVTSEPAVGREAFQELKRRNKGAQPERAIAE